MAYPISTAKNDARAFLVAALTAEGMTFDGDPVAVFDAMFADIPERHHPALNVVVLGDEAEDELLLTGPTIAYVITFQVHVELWVSKAGAITGALADQFSTLVETVKSVLGRDQTCGGATERGRYRRTDVGFTPDGARLMADAQVVFEFAYPWDQYEHDPDSNAPLSLVHAEYETHEQPPGPNPPEAEDDFAVP